MAPPVLARFWPTFTALLVYEIVTAWPAVSAAGSVNVSLPGSIACPDVLVRAVGVIEAEEALILKSAIVAVPAEIAASMVTESDVGAAFVVVAETILRKPTSFEAVTGDCVAIAPEPPENAARF
jgi:hypothetical protein